MNDEVNRSNEDMVKGGGEGGNEIHYERTPISEGAAGITIESEYITAVCQCAVK